MKQKPKTPKRTNNLPRPYYLKPDTATLEQNRGKEVLHETIVPTRPQVFKGVTE